MSIVSRLLNITLPKGGYAMAFAEMYFDESESTSPKILCVAGYLFKKERCESLESLWSEILLQENLPYFHMVECAHGNGIFEGFTKSRRIEIQTKLMDLLKSHMELGISITYDLRYESLCPSAKMHGIDIVSPYSLCSYFAMMQARKWAEENKFDGQISFFFEAGNTNQSQANHIMNEIFSVPELRAHYKYGAHSFIPKESSGALQCADILAWQWCKNVKERAFGNMKPRADLFSLLEKPHFTIHFDKKTLIEFNRVVDESNKRVAAATHSGTFKIPSF
jgi:hypothetical protein